MKDGFGREIDYLRISVTDRCNLRCRYCMPSKVLDIGHDEVLRFEEIERLVKLFASLGIKYVKITGGEPLVRRGLPELIGKIKAVRGIEKVTLTTNGVLLFEQLKGLIDSGIDGVNVSLDTLDANKYERLTGVSALDKVLLGIDECYKSGLQTKVNVVMLADENYLEITELASLARERKIDVRFIELMPIGEGKGYRGYQREQAEEVLKKAFGEPKIVKERHGNGPADYLSFEGFSGKIGFIGALSHAFCKDCNRVRLTADGQIKPCLQYASTVDLKSALRGGKTNEELCELIKGGILAKPDCHRFTGGVSEAFEKNNMNSIGG